MTKPIDSVTWHPATWQSRQTLQQPTYLDQQELQAAVAAISRLPPLVVSGEIDALKSRLAAAQRGECFVLQGGDCAESFDGCESDRIASQLKVLLQMSVVLLYGLKKPVVRIGRMAGQYAKPRSADTETRDGVTLPSYRGDNINRIAFTAADREPNPQLLLRGYERAALTLNFVRSLIDGGFADLHHPEYWDLDFVRHSPLREHYEHIVRSICSSLDFFEAMSGNAARETERVAFYVSHEALHLWCEQAQTRWIARKNRWYNLSTHLPWIGMRTAALDGAHVEYFRGIANPIAIKVGPSMEAAWVQRLLAILNRGISAASDRSSAGHGQHRAVDLRSHAWEHGNRQLRAQDTPLRQYRCGIGGGLPDSRVHGLAPRRRAFRAYRRECHGMHRRRARAYGCRFIPRL